MFTHASLPLTTTQGRCVDVAGSSNNSTAVYTGVDSDRCWSGAERGSRQPNSCSHLQQRLPTLRGFGICPRRHVFCCWVCDGTTHHCGVVRWKPVDSVRDTLAAELMRALHLCVTALNDMCICHDCAETGYSLRM